MKLFDDAWEAEKQETLAGIFLVAYGGTIVFASKNKVTAIVAKEIFNKQVSALEAKILTVEEFAEEAYEAGQESMQEDF